MPYAVQCVPGLLFKASTCRAHFSCRCFQMFGNFNVHYVHGCVRLFLKLFRATMRQCLDPKLCARASLALGAMPLFDSVDDVSVSENEPWSRLGRLVFSNFSTCFLLHPAQKGKAIDIRSAADEPPSDEVRFFSFVLGLLFCHVCNALHFPCSPHAGVDEKAKACAQRAPEAHARFLLEIFRVNGAA